MSEPILDRSEPSRSIPRPAAIRDAALGSWTLGMSPLRELASAVFGGAVPSSEEGIRNELLNLLLTPNLDESPRRIALRLLEHRKERSHETTSATAILALRQAEPPNLRVQSLGTLYTVRPDVADRLCLALTYHPDSELKSFGIIGLEQNSQSLFFRRGYELALESSTHGELRGSLIETINGMIGTRIGEEVPEVRAGVAVLPGLGRQVAFLCGLSSIPAEVRRDSVLAHQALCGSAAVRTASFSRLSRINAELAVVIAAANHEIASDSVTSEMRHLFLERAPFTARIARN